MTSRFNETTLSAWCSGHGGLDAVRFVSMKGEVARRRDFSKAFVPLFPSKLEFVEALNGKAIVREDPVLSGKVDSVSWLRIHRQDIRENHASIYTAGALGCALTHMRELERAAGAQGCSLIVESDMAGVDEAAWLELLEEFPVLPEHIDILWLNTISGVGSVGGGEGSSSSSSPSTIARIETPFMGTGAILYTPRGATKLLNFLRTTDSILTHQIDAVFTAAIARMRNGIFAAGTVKNIILTNPTSFMTTSIQTYDIKPYLPDSNWFYIAIAAIFLGFVISTSTLALRLKRR